ncbi:hypothetical protein GO003_023550 [Methylicorpusculum oleiharenae]|uniref:DUF6794 domain-containing protein n=1 Tax=Methylicorpusculum oleiharenae TaxID=1338687 RepID=UPI00135CF687|nr:DUF6794 domain-containing protein [Methylicorpusculum oleiharenae]MCD2453360.1 hypothetical protein [Methylicorpusculum oleiharenae]
MSKNWSTFLQDNSRYPETVAEAVDRLMEFLSGEEKLAIAGTPEEDLNDLHFTLGMTIRNAFGLHDEGSKLLDSCNQTLHPGAIYCSVHPDDASEVIIGELWRRLQDDD